MHSFSVQFNSTDELNQVVNTLVGLGYTQLLSTPRKDYKIVDVLPRQKGFATAFNPYTLIIELSDIEEVLLLMSLGTEHQTLIELFGIRGK